MEMLPAFELSECFDSNTSQVTTQAADSQPSGSQLSIGSLPSSARRRVDCENCSVIEVRKPSTHAESAKDFAAQTGEVDGFTYTRPGPAWTETTNVPREQLGFVQVVAFMINQSVGNGIFYNPGAVLLLTKSKVVSVVLWIVGGMYSILSACVFLEYSTALPYNGGPLIYLDEVFPTPKMLVAIIFSWYSILLNANNTNAVTAATYTLQLYYPQAASDEIDPHLIQFVAIITVTAACFLLYFLQDQFLLLNSIMAGFKVTVLAVFFIAGIVHAKKHGSGLADFTKQYEGVDAVDQIAAMTYVLSAYEGWEYTTYIAGEIRSSEQTLKSSSFTALGLLTVLYSLLSVAFYAVLPYGVIVGSQWDISLLFARAVFGNGKATQVSVMLSTLMNLLVNTYTTAKVLQAIAWQRIIPFGEFFGQQDRQFNSPGGALVLHWIVTVIHLTIRLPVGDSFHFASGLFVYGLEIMIVFLGIGIFLLPRRMQHRDPEWRPSFTKSMFSKFFIVGITAGVSILLLYSLAQPSAPGTVPRYWWPITMGTIVGAAVVYWAGIRLLEMTWWSKDNSESLGYRMGFEVSIIDRKDDVPDDFANLVTKARNDGARQIITYKLNGRLEKFSLAMKNSWKFLQKYLG